MVRIIEGTARHQLCQRCQRDEVTRGVIAGGFAPEAFDDLGHSVLDLLDKPDWLAVEPHDQIMIAPPNNGDADARPGALRYQPTIGEIGGYPACVEQAKRHGLVFVSRPTRIRHLALSIVSSTIE